MNLDYAKAQRQFKQLVDRLGTRRKASELVTSVSGVSLTTLDTYMYGRNGNLTVNNLKAIHSALDQVQPDNEGLS